jgi:GNAT superfamily N-acetyltransferase
MVRGSRSSAAISILTAASDVMPFIQDVQDAADANKDAFGFLPAPAYIDFAIQGTLFVAVRDRRYAGHLAFGGRYPHIRIRQLNVAKSFRAMGIGRRLLDALRRYAEDRSYLTLHANVADDLDANAFWEREGLVVVNKKPGGKSRNRTINVRELLLSQQDLLSTIPKTRIGDSALSMDFHSKADSRRYALDLNFLIDAVRQRGAFGEHATQVLAAAFKRKISLTLTPEADVEILRNKGNRTQDPLYAIALALPRMPPINPDSIKKLREKLAQVVFPTRARIADLTLQESSDLLHLAYCIELRVGGFITRDAEILSSRDRLRSDFNLDVVAPAELLDDLEPPESSRFVPQTLDQETNISVRRANSEERLHRIPQMLEAARQANTGCPEFAIDDDTSVIVAFDETGIAAVTWGPAPSVINPNVSWTIVFLGQSTFDVLIADQFLAHILQSSAQVKTSSFELTAIGSSYSAIDHLKRRGCLELHRPANGPPRLLKIAATGYVDPTNLQEHLKMIRDSAGIDIVASARTDTKTIGFTHTSRGKSSPGQTNWFDLATIAGPVLYLFPCRFGLLVPIEARFAEELLGTRQTSMFSVQSARLRTERVYFRKASRLDSEAGMPIVFRESKRGGGTGSAIGCARLTDYGLYETNVAKSKFRSQGVMDLERYEVGKSRDRVGVLVFDNFQEFQRPVSFPALQTLEAIGGNGNITAETLSIATIRKILELGFKREQ